MKKLLTALLVVAMMLSFVGAAFADSFGDVADQSKEGKSAITKLNALDVINGYPDGTFKPANTITRAEFAKIAVTIAGLKDSADVLKNTPSKFKDVKSGEWYTGWINLASAQGYVKGFPEGTFKPNANISNAEVVTVLLRVLGYNDNLPGPWPVDYIAKAGTLGVTDDVSFNASAPATRGDVAIMTSTTLDQDVMYWNKDEEDFSQKASLKTLIQENFKGAVLEDFRVTAWTIDKDGVFSITVSGEGDNPTTTIVETTFTATLDVAKAVQMAGANVIPKLNNHRVDFIYDKGEKEIAFMEVISTKISSDDLSYDIARDELKIDGTKYNMADGWTTSDTTVTTNALLKTFVGSGYFTVYLNDDGDVYHVVKNVGTGSPRLVDEYKANTQKLSFKVGSTLDLKDKKVIVVKDNKYATVADIAENNVVYVTTDPGKYDYYLDVRTINDSGKLVAAYLNTAGTAVEKIKIDSTKYTAGSAKISTDNGDDFDSITEGSLKDSYNTTIKYFLAMDNSIAFVISNADESDSSTLYGIVTEVVNKRVIAPFYITEVKILNEKGETVSYLLDTTDDDAKAFTVADGGPKLLGTDTYVKYTVNEAGKIDSVETLTPAPKTMDADKDSDRIIIGGETLFVTDKTVVLNAAYTDSSSADDKEADLETVADILKYFDDNAGSFAGIYAKKDGNKLEYLFIDTYISVTADYALIVDKYRFDGKDWVDINNRGEKESYELSGSADKYSVYKYNLSGSKLAATTKVTGTVAGQVYDVDASRNAIKVYTSAKPGTDGKGLWYVIDEDSYIFDYSDYYDDGSKPTYVSSIGDVEEDDMVSILMSTDPDKKNNIEFIFITNNKVGSTQPTIY